MKGIGKIMTFLLLLVLCVPALAGAQTDFNRIVVFGTSLSDPGNRFALEGGVTTPPYSSLADDPVPLAAYAVGGHHFSNGQTWVEQLARSYKLAGNTRPAFADLDDTNATNYAVGGARARNVEGFKNFSYQVAAFLSDYGSAPADALYVIEFGGNDLRDMLQAQLKNEDPTPIFQGAIQGIIQNMGLLYHFGARKFLVCTAPDLSLAPIVPADFAPLVKQLVAYFNYTLNVQLMQNLGGAPAIEITWTDFFAKVNDMAANASDYGLTEIRKSCITPDLAPFHCQNPDEYLFWDGVHPTRAAHAILAEQVAHDLGK